MRILHIGKYYPPFSGGIENFMGALLPELAANGAEVAALVHHYDPKAGFAARLERKVQVYRSPIRGRFLFAPVSLSFPRHLAWAVREFKPDVVHVHMPNVSAFWVFFLRSCRNLPLVVHWHADVVASRLHLGLALAYPLYRPFERRLLARGGAVIATSPPYLETSVPLKPFRDKCRVIPLGLAAGQELDPVKTGLRAHKYWGNDPSPLRVLSVGRLTYYKGHEVLIRAVAALDGAQAIIVGTGDRRAALEKLLTGLRADGKLALYGAAPAAELRELMQSCDCLCLPSIERTEAFGLVLLEAMRAGKPVIATDVGGSGMSWVARNGETGLIVLAGDVAALQAAIARLRDDEGLRIAMGKAGREHFARRFDIGRVANETLALYREMLGKG